MKCNVHTYPNKYIVVVAGGDDKAYRCVYEEEDPQGKIGISLSKDLMSIAGEALKSNITTIGPLVLPASEQILFLLSLIGRKIFNPKWKPYIPDFKQARSTTFASTRGAGR